MHKPNIKAAYNAMKKSTIKHSPEILTGIGIAGMVTTTVMAVRATPKALKLRDIDGWNLRWSENLIKLMTLTGLTMTNL